MRNEYEVHASTTDTDHPTGTDHPAVAATVAAAPAKVAATAGKPAVVEEVLIEEVSIDGMCGVY